MYDVYVIKNEIFPNQFYTGFTKNIDSRLDDHNSGKSPHTNKYKPWKLAYYCAFESRKKLWILKNI